MNIRQIILLLIFVCSSLICSAQKIQVHEMNVKRFNEKLNTKDEFELKLFVSIDVTDFETINQEKTSFKSIVDDTGYDLLAGHNKEQEKIADKWYYDPAIITGFGSDRIDSGIRSTIELKAAPKPTAKTISIEGILALDYNTGNQKTYIIKDIPLEMDIESDGIKTEIGYLKIYPTGGFTVNNNTYSKFNVSGDAPIMHVDVKGNSDTQKLRAATDIGDGTSTGIAFVDPPETVTLIITVKEMRTETVSLNLSVSLGL